MALFLLANCIQSLDAKRASWETAETEALENAEVLCESANGRLTERYRFAGSPAIRRNYPFAAWHSESMRF